MFPPVILAAIDEKTKLYSEFEHLAIPHMDILYNFALRMTGNKKLAARLLKETYSKAFWFFDKLEESTNYKMWLFRVMRNAYLNSYSKKSEEVSKNDYAYIEDSYEKIKTSSTDNSVLQKEISIKLSYDEISEALSSLPEDFRILLILCDIEKFSYEDIADFVDVPLGVVKSRIYRAREMLFIKLYKYV